MTSAFTAMTKDNNGWWIGWIEQVQGVNAQERSREELPASLREVPKEAVDAI